MVAIQATIRGMLTRQELWKAAKSRAALDSGVLVAVTGTSQGQTGWYMGQSREYFYFCLEENDFVLLTGPVKERDFQKLVDRTKEYHVVKEMVHRTALAAIRDQLKTFAEKHLEISAHCTLTCHRHRADFDCTSKRFDEAVQHFLPIQFQCEIS